ncbi:MAG: hypothetical protein NTU97_04745, partial [Candidatus Magasanikbacteria bacterium]|nr:hypothetical protein [Candidatus Magasanikbacteria bacterium]
VHLLEDSPLERIVITNSIPVQHKLAGTTKFRVLPIDGLLAEAISRTVQKDSITILHDINSVPLYRDS